jgi:hypothetical protein
MVYQLCRLSKDPGTDAALLAGRVVYERLHVSPQPNTGDFVPNGRLRREIGTAQNSIRFPALLEAAHDHPSHLSELVPPSLCLSELRFEVGSVRGSSRRYVRKQDIKQRVHSSHKLALLSL